MALRPGRPASLRPAGLPLWPNATPLIQERGNTVPSDPNRAPMVGSDPRYRKASPWDGDPSCMRGGAQSVCFTRGQITHCPEKTSVERRDARPPSQAVRPRPGRPAPNRHNRRGFNLHRLKDKIKTVRAEVGDRWREAQAGRPGWGRPAPGCRLSPSASSGRLLRACHASLWRLWVHTDLPRL